MNMLSISQKYNEYVYYDCIQPEMKGCLRALLEESTPGCPVP